MIIWGTLSRLYDPALGATATNGMIYAPGYINTALGITAGSANLRGIDVGRALRTTTWANFAPRLGFAWDSTGAARWSIRGGAGIFYAPDSLSHPNDDMEGNPPFNSTATCGTGRPFDSLGPPSLCGIGLGTPTYATDTNWIPQGSYEWNFTIERQLTRDSKLEVSYVGNRGVRLPILFGLNQPPLADFKQYQIIGLTPGSNGAQDKMFRPFYALKGTSNSFSFETNGGNSIYYALQVYLTKQFSRGNSFGVSYAFGRTLSDTTQGCCGDSTGPASNQLAVNELPNYYRGLSNFDRTHILSVNWIYDVPSFAGHSALYRGVLGSWESTGVYSRYSGLPLFVTGGVANCPANGGLCRPDFLASVQPHTPNQWFSPNDYGSPTVPGDIGNAAPANLRGPGANNFDLAIYKNFPLHWERTALQFRVETFNTFNHTQLLSVNTSYQSAAQTMVGNSIGCVNSQGVNMASYCNTNISFGKPLATRPAREIQFALKFIF